MMIKRWCVQLTALAALTVWAGCSSSSGEPSSAEGDLLANSDRDTPALQDVQLVSISDWHGQLDPSNGVGGAAYLSTYFKQERALMPTMVLTAGDAFGATPPLSNFFNDEPAVKALNILGIAADTFGNHNFDNGIAGLQHLIDLSNYKYVSANLGNLQRNLKNVAQPFIIQELGGVKVGIVGVTNDDAPSLSFPGNLGSLEVWDSATSANWAILLARLFGAKVVVVLVHMGATHVDATGTPTGPLIDFANKVRHADVIFGDHTDIAVNTTTADGTTVVENRSFGVTYTKVQLHLAHSKILSKTVSVVSPVNANIVPDQAVTDMLAPYRAQLSAVFDTTIATSSDVFVRGSNIERLQEMPIGNLVADAVRLRYGTQLAIVNSGGLRAPIPSTYAPADHALRRTAPGYAAGPPYDVVLGDIYAVLPFGNTCVTRSVTGTQLYAILEHSVGSLPAAFGGFMQISGFKFTYSAAAPAGARVTSATLDNGTPITNDGTTYTFATSNFTNAGGDGYAMLADGQGTTRDVMADVLRDYVKANPALVPTTSGRIVAQ